MSEIAGFSGQAITTFSIVRTRKIVFVTSNVDDFVKLAAAREIHAGIVLIERGGLLRDLERRAFRQLELRT